MKRENKIKVSVLVPIYNVKSYLRECLDSLAGQTLREIEIICINDGSTDGSKDIIKEYVKKDSRFVLLDKKNSGYGDSMNRGLKKARGQFVGIVESDDFVRPEMFGELYEFAKKKRAQVVKSNWYKYWTDTHTTVRVVATDEKNYNKVVKPSDGEFGIFYQIPSIWSAIYEREFLLNNKINFVPSPGASYQDTGFAYKVWVMAEKVSFINKAYLYYRQDNANSSMNNIAKKAPALFSEFDTIYTYLEKRGKDELISLLKEREFVSDHNFLIHMRSVGFKEYQKKMNQRFAGVKIPREYFENQKFFFKYRLFTKHAHFTYFYLRIFRPTLGLVIRTLRKVKREKEVRSLLNVAGDDWLNEFVLAPENNKTKHSDKISIIVPVYNNAEFLPRCLDSLIKQSHKNLEIVIVDAGSTDGSTDILRKYVSKDKRIKLISQKNSNIAEVRNVGLKSASADYIMWCNSTDYYQPKMCENMLGCLLNSGCDMVECGTNVFFSEETKNPDRSVEKYLELKFRGRQTVGNYLFIETNAALTNKIYRKKNIQENKIIFPKGKFFEGAYFNDVYLMNSGSVYYLSEKLYNYYHHDRGAAGIDITQMLFEYLQKNKLYDKWQEAYWEKFCRYNSFALNNVFGRDRIKMRRQVREFLKKHHTEIAQLGRSQKVQLRKIIFFTYGPISLMKKLVKR
ncbi:glycosyltransferase [Candidatus Saccharibacteria bacterium]|nr:glycosyltransferase [Candidatus Saccharibacteria bacterium]